MPSELLKRHHRKWEEWEDDIIRDKYPRGGSLSAALFLNRTVNAIASRGFYLGIRRHPEKQRISKGNPAIQEKRHLKREGSKEKWLKVKDQRRLESQRVKEERLRAKEKRWFEWKQIIEKHARIKEQKIRLKIEQIKFKTMQLVLREKRRIE
jgi:hypothetical protein